MGGERERAAALVRLLMLLSTAAGVVGAAGWPLLSLKLLLVGQRMGRRGRGG